MGSEMCIRDRFVTDLFGVGESRVVRFGHHLDDALMVPQIDEADAAEVPGHVRPAAQGDGLADMGFVDLTAVMATHGAWGSWMATTRYFKGLGATVRAFQAFFEHSRQSLPTVPISGRKTAHRFLFHSEKAQYSGSNRLAWESADDPSRYRPFYRQSEF